MASYTIEIPEGLHREIQERRHRIDVASVCKEALSAAVTTGDTSRFGADVAEDITRLYNS